MSMQQWAELIDRLEDVNVKLEGELLLAGSGLETETSGAAMPLHGRLSLINKELRAALKLAREMYTAERYSGG